MATRDKQLALWRDLILQYYTKHKLKTLHVGNCPLWSNDTIGRKLSPQDRMIVCEDFVQHGQGEWILEGNSEKAEIRILWRKPEQLALDIYQWAEQNGYSGGGVCTFYELHSGEDVNGMSFEGCDEELLRRALAILESQHKCTVFQGETSSEDGIKFN